MTTPRDPDGLIQAFIREGAEQLQDQVYDVVRAHIEQKRQRAVIGSWRVPTVSRLWPVGLGAAAVIAVLFLGSRLIGSATPSVGGNPTATATPESTPAPTLSTRAGLPKGLFAWFDPTGPSEPRTGVPPITVTIPTSGWTCPQVGYEACILIEGGGEDSLSVPDGRLPESALIATFTTRGIHVYQDPCQWAYNLPDPPATTADQIAAALAAQASRDASDPVDVTVGGYPGKKLTVHVPDDLGYAGATGFTDCFRGVYASYTYGDHDASGTLPTRWHQGPGQIDTFWIVDVDDAIVIIDAMYRSDTPADRIAEMSAIAESATFEAH